MPPRLEDENHDKPEDDKKQEENAFAPSRVLLIAVGSVLVSVKRRILKSRSPKKGGARGPGDDAIYWMKRRH